MTSIERTAYPRLTQYLSVQELEAIYTPADMETLPTPTDFTECPQLTWGYFWRMA